MKRIFSRLFFSRRHKNNAAMPHNGESGNIITVLLGAVALTGLLGAAVYNLMSGPFATMSRINATTIAQTDMMSTSRIVIMQAVTGSTGGDCDADGIVEPVAWRSTTGNKPTNGGLIPTTLGVTTADPWGTDYGYCVWDAGATSDAAGCGGPSALRLDGDNDPSTGTATGAYLASDDQTVMALISAGPDRMFQTSCSAYNTNDATNTTLVTQGGDDIVLKYTYAEAAKATSALWSLTSGGTTQAAITKDVTITGSGGTNTLTSAGAASFVGVNATGLVTGTKGVQLGTPSSCSVAGLLRYNSGAVEVCDGAAWVSAGSGGGGGGGSTCTDDLVGYWSLNEASGYTVADGSCYGSDGEIMSGTTAVIGPAESARAFDGTNDFIQIPNNTGIDGVGSNITISAWVKINHASASAYIISKPWDEISTGYQYSLFWDTTTNRIDFQFSEASGVGHTTASFIAPGNNVWSHIAVTYNGVNIKGYLNGQLVNTTAETHTIAARGTPLYFGDYDATNTYSLTGSIDEVRIYKRALTQNEIIALYANALPSSSGDTTTGLVSRWKFDETSGTSAADSAGTNTATTANGPTWTTSGFDNGALSFDGVNDYAYAADSASLDVTQITMSAWVYKTVADAVGWRTVMSRQSGAGVNDNVILGYDPNAEDYYTCGIRTSNGQVDVTSDQASTTDVNTWVHLACTYDGSQIILYKNGINIGSAGQTGDILAETKPFVIGGNNNGGPFSPDEYFPGRIDDARLYSRALSADDVRTLITGGSALGNSQGSGSGSSSGGTASTITVRQASTFREGRPNDPDSSSFAALPEIGNTIIVFVNSNAADPGTAVYDSLAVSDNQGNTYHLAAMSGNGGGNPVSDMRQFIYYASNIGRPSGTFTVSIDPVGAPAGWGFNSTWGAIEVSGLAATNALDVTGSIFAVNNTSQTVSTSSPTTQADALAVAINYSNSNDADINYGHDGTWTEHFLSEQPMNLVPISAVSKVLSSTGTISHQWTFDNGNNDNRNQSLIAVFKANVIPPDFTSGLKGRWAFDESSGTTAYDSSGNGNNGILTNGPAWDSSGGHINGALSFDGTNDQVEVAYNSSIAMRGALTVSAWTYLDTNGVTQALISRNYDGSSNRGYSLYVLNTDSKVYFTVSGDCNAEPGVASTAVAPTGQWVHWAAVYVPSTGIYLYKNGVLDNSNTSSIPASLCDNGKTLGIGHRPTGAAAAWPVDGKIDDARIYDRALTSDDIAALYASTSGNGSSSGRSAAIGGGIWKNDGDDNISWTTSSTPNNTAIIGPNVGTCCGTLTTTGDSRSAAFRTYNSCGSECGSEMYLRLARGTLAGPVATSSGDKTGGLYWGGYTSGAPNPYYSNAAIRSVATATPGIAVAQSKLEFFMEDTNGSNNVPIRINDQNQFFIGYGLASTAQTEPFDVLGVSPPVVFENYYGYDSTAAHGATALLRRAKGGTVGNITSGLVGFWKFDQSSGTSVTDSSGNSLTGTLTNGPTWTTSGKIGSAASFDGTNDYGSVAYNSLLNIKRVTMSAWVYKTTANASGWPSIMSRQYGSSTDDLIWLGYDDSASDYYTCSVQTTNGLKGVISTTASTGDINTWVHVSCTYDGANIMIYRNGTLIGTLPETGDMQTDTTALTFASNNNTGSLSPSDFFPGRIDEIRLYKRALSANEITALYNTTGSAALADGDVVGQIDWKGYDGNSLENTARVSAQVSTSNSIITANYGGTTDGLVAHYKFDEAVGATTLSDSSGNGNTAYIDNWDGYATISTITSSGKISNALQCQSASGGSNGYFHSAQAAPSSSINSLGAKTISAWINLTGQDSELQIASKIDGGVTNGFMLRAINTTQVEFIQGGFFDYSWSGYLATGSWYHVALTWGGSLSTAPKLYVNGTLRTATSTFSYGGTTIDDSTRTLYIGEHTDFPNPTANAGALDDVRIFNRELSADEVLSIYNNAIGNSTVSTTNVPTDMLFYTGSTSANIAEVMRISSQGKVGIKTTAPRVTLDIDGVFYGSASGQAAGYASTVGKRLAIISRGLAGGECTQVNTNCMDSGTAMDHFGFGQDADVENQSLNLGWNNGRAVASGFMIGESNRSNAGCSSGLIGRGNECTSDNNSAAIGLYNAVGGSTTTDARYAIGAWNDLSAAATNIYALGYGMTVSGNYSFGIGLDTAKYTLSQANTMAIMGGSVGIDKSNPAHVLDVVGTAGLSTGTAWTNTSDIRLKNILGDYERGLADIMKLHSVRFHYKKGNPAELPSDQPMIGFIAQEVQPVFPEAIHTRDDGYLDFNIHSINVAMINAARELKERNDKASAANEALRAENAALEDDIASANADLARIHAAMQGRAPFLEGAIVPAGIVAALTSLALLVRSRRRKP